MNDPRPSVCVIRAASLGALLLALIAGGCTKAPPAATPIEIGTIERTSPDGPVRGRWAKIHLDQPGVQVLVTGPVSPSVSDPRGTEAHLETVPDWAAETHATLAINANFFSLRTKPGTENPEPGYRDALPADLVGLSISGGKLVSPPRVHAGRGDPALLILRHGRARVAYADKADLAEVVAAVAGMGPSDDGKRPGSFLVTDGRNTGATARVAPEARHPRTAVGVSADGRTLILAVVDGRQPEHSIGATLPELATLMIELGAANALNLDGGGSSSFVYTGPDGAAVINHPSGGAWRPVGNHLGVTLRPR
ncbi:MAG: phosphodiester glycosidase family protein [Opitutae bacterium]|nr:phosphodiester glycosidase family protein [Opitutae bacterium]